MTNIFYMKFNIFVKPKGALLLIFFVLICDIKLIHLLANIYQL